jgi:hypothetical protein
MVIYRQQDQELGLPVELEFNTLHKVIAQGEIAARHIIFRPLRVLLGVSI